MSWSRNDSPATFKLVRKLLHFGNRAGIALSQTRNDEVNLYSIRFQESDETINKVQKMRYRRNYDRIREKGIRRG